MDPVIFLRSDVSFTFLRYSQRDVARIQFRREEPSGDFLRPCFHNGLSYERTKNVVLSRSRITRLITIYREYAAAYWPIAGESGASAEENRISPPGEIREGVKFYRSSFRSWLTPTYNALSDIAAYFFYTRSRRSRSRQKLFKKNLKKESLPAFTYLFALRTTIFDFDCACRLRVVLSLFRGFEKEFVANLPQNGREGS